MDSVHWFKRDLSRLKEILFNVAISSRETRMGSLRLVSFFKFFKLDRGGMKILVKAILVAGSVIYLIINGLFWVSSLLTKFLGLPATLGLQPVFRAGGWTLLVAGVVLALWLLRYRSPASMIISTYYTFVKMITGAPVSKSGGRTELLVLEGPQKYVRHPLYLSALTAFLGWALVTGSTSSLLGVAFLLIWFVSIQIPFEEKELCAMFGDQYRRYSEDVPMLIPSIKRKQK